MDLVKTRRKRKILKVRNLKVMRKGRILDLSEMDDKLCLPCRNIYCVFLAMLSSTIVNIPALQYQISLLCLSYMYNLYIVHCTSYCLETQIQPEKHEKNGISTPKERGCAPTFFVAFYCFFSVTTHKTL